MTSSAHRFRSVPRARSRALAGRVLAAASLGLALPLLAARPAQACSCLPPTVESSYNRSSDVIEARVLLSVPVGNERWSVARVSATYKGCLQPSELVLLTTSSSSASCGVSLQTGVKYLINGSDDGGAIGLHRLSIGLCDYNLPAADLTDHDRAFLDGREVCCGDECSCANGEQPVQCFAQPCSVAPACDVEGAVCVDNYCGGCNAEFYDGFGNAVCQAPAGCSSDADCSADSWCRQRAEPATGSECVPFAGEGQTCGGFRPASSFERCGPGLICDTPDFVADAPGICRRGCASDADCTRTGCSGQLCASEPRITTCEFRPEYACFGDPRITTCGCRDGACGFDPTPELDQCLSNGGP
jgi:eight-cysteine-cluster-containing protein